jgi:hypothetical protein
MTWSARFPHGRRSKSELPFWLRAVVFGLGALPQAVKLLACRGIPVSQTWAMLWVSSFVIFEVVDVAAREPDDGYRTVYNDQAAPVDEIRFLTLARYRESFVYLGLLAHAVFLLWANMYIKERIPGDDRLYGVLIPISFLITCKLFDGVVLGCSTPTLLYCWGYPVLYMVVLMLGRQLDIQTAIIVIRSLAELHPLVAVGFLSVVLVGFILLCLGFQKRTRSAGTTVYLLWIGLEMIAIPFAYYCFVYDSEGTLKPVWTEQLG